MVLGVGRLPFQLQARIESNRARGNHRHTGTTGTQPLHTAETTQLQADPTGMQRQIMSGTLGVAALQAFGVYLFISGFLCTRQELANRSSCADPQALCTAWLPCSLAYAGPRECSSAAKRTVPEFRFVVLLIVGCFACCLRPGTRVASELTTG